MIALYSVQWTGLFCLIFYECPLHRTVYRIILLTLYSVFYDCPIHCTVYKIHSLYIVQCIIWLSVKLYSVFYPVVHRISALYTGFPTFPLVGVFYPVVYRFSALYTGFPTFPLVGVFYPVVYRFSALYTGFPTFPLVGVFYPVVYRISALYTGFPTFPLVGVFYPVVYRFSALYTGFPTFPFVGLGLWCGRDHCCPEQRIGNLGRCSSVSQRMLGAAVYQENIQSGYWPHYNVCMSCDIQPGYWPLITMSCD